MNEALGYDFNTVEFAVKTEFLMRLIFVIQLQMQTYNSVGQANFDWIVENAAKYAIEKAKEHKDGAQNIDWGNFVKGNFKRI